VTIREFVSLLQERHDFARARSINYREVVVSFIAPNSGFCGPTIRPKYLGDNEEGEGRYGLTRKHVEELLAQFDVTLPPEFRTT
jgi:hypothetical protein